MDSLFSRSGKSVAVADAPRRSARSSLQNASDAWRLILNMHQARESVVKQWRRQQKLYRMIDEHPGHPDNDTARERADSLENLIMTDQLVFLDSEWRLRQIWEDMSPSDRTREAMHDMLHIDPETPTVEALWHVTIAETMKGAPLECSIRPVVLQFVSPIISRTYDRGRLTQQ